MARYPLDDYQVKPATLFADDFFLVTLASLILEKIVYYYHK